MYRTSITRWRRPVRLALPLLLLGLSACSPGASGPVSSEQRNVDDFHSIDLRGAADVNVSVGASRSVTLTASTEALRDITTNVQNGVLIVNTKSGGWKLFGPRRKIEVHLALPILNALTVNGAGNVKIEGIQGSAVALVLQGAGNVEASGSTSALNARLNGAGNMDLARLRAGDATVAVNGAGNLELYVSGSLQASVNGVGAITYIGNPRTVEPQINGVGSIKPASSQDD
jgi:hypothetical protein